MIWPERREREEKKKKREEKKKKREEKKKKREEKKKKSGKEEKKSGKEKEEKRGYEGIRNQNKGDGGVFSIQLYGRVSLSQNCNRRCIDDIKCRKNTTSARK
jgi:outer membrane biosynthesis protein TonB